MKQTVINTIFLVSLICLFGCLNEKKENASEALGGTTTITFLGWNRDETGKQIKTNRIVELNYDLKNTIDNAKNIIWDCKCPHQDTLIIDNEFYSIFGDCDSQDGYQLVRREDNYYLIKKKLKIIEK